MKQLIVIFLVLITSFSGQKNINNNLEKTSYHLSENSTTILANAEKKEKKTLAQKLAKRKIMIIPAKLTIRRAC